MLHWLLHYIANIYTLWVLRIDDLLQLLKQLMQLKENYCFFFIIIQETYLMTDWFSLKMNLNAIIITLKSDFTNNAIEIQFLKHFIKYIDDVKSHSKWKLLLMNNYENYETAEFLKLINNNHIFSYLLFLYFIYYMQFFDVDVFQSYKHWHDKIIQNIFANLSFQYNIWFFLDDFFTIQTNIFTKKTIQHVFKKSEMWFIDVKQCFKQLKTFNFLSKLKIDKSILFILS